jgi:cytosine/adenosine deaminase-related metal-dependent hydrolase
VSAPVVAWRADWVLPVTREPIPDGAVAASEGRIVHVGPRGEVAAALGDRERSGTAVEWRDLGRSALLPALVNAHTHLELSWMAGRLPRAAPMLEWVGALVELRRREGPDEAAAAVEGITQSLAFGTGVVGDVSNSLASCGPLSRSPLRAVVFHEVISFNPSLPPADLVGQAADRARAAQAPGVDVTLAAHAPYSVAPAVFREIACAADDLRPGVTSVHLAESPDEVTFLREGTGPWRALLEQVGAWSGAWRVPACGPVEYLDRVGFLRPGLLAVHGVQLTRPEVDRLASVGATIVTCPRSNARLGVGSPPAEAFFDSGVNVAIGTDSLASNDDLNVFAEIAALRPLVPRVVPRRLLAAATINGARALRVDAEYGSLDAGKRAAMISIDLGPGVTDVEAHLVAGVEASRVSWVRA